MLRLYTDESPGLKVDPMVVLFLSLGFIFSVVALHRKSNLADIEDAHVSRPKLTAAHSHRKDHEEILIRGCGLELEYPGG